MQQNAKVITVQTSGPGMTNITRELNQMVRESDIDTGLLTCMIQHTSASLTVQENADPDVQRDLTVFMNRTVPRSHNAYLHSAEGADDMPAHIKTSLTDVQLSIPVFNGELALGTWQAVYVFEHRDRPHTRRVALHLLGE